MRVTELMSLEPLVLAKEESIEVAEMFMHFAHIRHLPVVHEGEVVGLVTHRDLLRATTLLLQQEGERTEDSLRIRVDSIMRKDVRTIDVDTDVRSAIDIMMDHKYGCLPVTRAGKLVGIITEADFLKFTRRRLSQGEF